MDTLCMTEMVYQSNGEMNNSLVKNAQTTGYPYEKFPIPHFIHNQFPSKLYI